MKSRHQPKMKLYAELHRQDGVHPGMLRRQLELVISGMRQTGGERGADHSHHRVPKHREILQQRAWTWHRWIPLPTRHPDGRRVEKLRPASLRNDPAEAQIGSHERSRTSDMRWRCSHPCARFNAPDPWIPRLSGNADINAVHPGQTISVRS